MAKKAIFDKASARRIARIVRDGEAEAEASSYPAGDYAAVAQLGVSRRVRLAEDHPGKDIVFNVYLEIGWDKGSHAPIFSSDTVKAIDLDEGVPAVAKDGQFFATPRASDAHGYVWVLGTGDCEPTTTTTTTTTTAP